MNASQKKAVIAALCLKGTGMCKCPLCGNPNWRLDDNVANMRLHSDVTADGSVGPAGLPCVVLVCFNCGFVRMHALAVLNLLIREKKEEPEKEPDEEFPWWRGN